MGPEKWADLYADRRERHYVHDFFNNDVSGNRWELYRTILGIEYV